MYANYITVALWFGFANSNMKSEFVDVKYFI